MTMSTMLALEGVGVFQDIAEAIGRTPMVRLNRVTRGLSCAVYAKLEMFNPGGSVKDRIAIPMLETYEQEGILQPGGTVVEATSGNTGVGLAIVCALKGYHAVFVMPDKMSDDKVRLLRAYGARVVITPTDVPPDDPRSYYSVARNIVAETPGAVLANQYHNPNNPRAHYDTTAREIWEQTEGHVTDIVASMGTGGTITGIARYMRDHGHRVRIVGVDPVGSILYGTWKQGGSTDGLEARTYKVEGIGEDFVPSTLDLSLVDDVIQVGDAEAFRWTRRLVREEAIFCGGSSGAALAGALRAGRDLGPDRVVVVVFPDSGYRYLSKVFNDDWMREHDLLDEQGERITAMQVAAARGLAAVIVATESDSMHEVIGRMRAHAVSQLPVVGQGGEMIGLVSEVELLDHMLHAGHRHPCKETVAGVVKREVATARPDTPFEDLLPNLLSHKVVVLIDDLGQPAGILTMIDALEYLSTRGDT